MRFVDAFLYVLSNVSLVSLSRCAAAGRLDDEIDAAFQDLGLDMGDLDGLLDGPSAGNSGGGNNTRAAPASTSESRAWEDEMAEMDRFLDEAGAGAPRASSVTVTSSRGGDGGRVSVVARPAAAAPKRDVTEDDAALKVSREQPTLVRTQYAGGDATPTAVSTAGLDEVDNLLGQIKGEESHQLADSTQFIVNQDAISNCVIDFISLYTKLSQGPLPPEDVTEFVSLTEFLREEIMANYDKFALWLETLPNENLVSLHANRNQLKQSSAALLEVVKRYAGDSKKSDIVREIQTRVQTIVGDCWSFYVNSNDPWKYDHVVFYQVEELIKVAKRLLLAAKCESGEDWVTVCLLASNQAVVVARVCNFVSFTKRNLHLQKDISNVVVLLAKLIKRTMQVGDDCRRAPDNAKFKSQLNELQKAFIAQIRVLHQKVRAPVAAADSVVYTPEILLELATGYKSASKSLLDSIDNYCSLFGSSSDVDVQELIELGEFISRDISKMAKLFRDVPAALVVNVLNVAFNVSKLARIIVKWAELPSTHALTRDLLLSAMQTALNYSIQAKLLSSLKAASYPVVEIESSTYTAMRGLSMAISALYDACCFLDVSAMGTGSGGSDSDPNAVAQATALCLHFGHPTPVERKLELEDHFADNPDLNLRKGTTAGPTGGAGDALDDLDLDLNDDATLRGRSNTATLNADDLLNSVEDLLADPSLQQRTPTKASSTPAARAQPAAAAKPAAAPAPVEDDEADFPPLQPLPLQPPPLSDTDGYKDYMRLKYEHQQRENAILLRQMKRERAQGK